LRRDYRICLGNRWPSPKNYAFLRCEVVYVYGNVLAAETYLRSKTTTVAAAACTDVLLPRSTTRLVPSAAPHTHTACTATAVVVQSAAAANTTDLLSIAAAAAAYTFSFFLYSFHIIRSTPHSSPSRQQSSFYSRDAHLYTHHVYRYYHIFSFIAIIEIQRL